ncbi:MAG: TetR/AcrR family transcriptional regulator [Coriobacteriia bacterium]|nr:TetR/AcrR family transcriptional regulator [Coriobacteriia bacterium]MBN2821995.1 TetR/AcrR family transcriptional regulator [Coriobacteriia bacterium]
MTDLTASPAINVRDRILDAAMRLFVDKGYHPTTIPDIVKASGTSIGAVYHHFEGKEDLARQLHQQVIAEFMGFVGAEVLNGSNAETSIRAYTELMFRLTEERPYFVSYLLHARPRAVVDDNLTVCSREGLEVTSEIIRIGKANGEIIDADERVLCGLISGTIMRIVDMRADHIVPGSLIALVDPVAELIWRAIRI